MQRHSGLRLQPLALLPAILLTLMPPGAAHAQSTCPEYWTVATRGCPQALGSDPTPYLQACRLEAGCLVPRQPTELIAASMGRPVVVLVHGSYYDASAAAEEGARMRAELAATGAVTPDALVVEFDWPSQMQTLNIIRDANDKARRAFVAGYHLARFLQGFPQGARIGLVGHSHGGLTVLAALHLLGGGVLNDGREATSLASFGPPSRLRAVVIAAACDRHWLEPGRRFDHALAASEAVLSFYNPLDPVLFVYPFGRYSEHRRALGKAGMRAERAFLGQLADRYREVNVAPLLGPRHTFRGTMVRPEVAPWLAAYLWASGG